MSELFAEAVTRQSGFRGTFAALHIRNYRYFWFGQLVSSTGNWLTNLALTLFVLQLTDSGVAVGALIACQYGPFLILSAWAGSLADRVNKRKLLLVTQSLELLQTAALVVLAFTPDPHLPIVYLVALLGGVFLAVDNPARRAFVTELVPVTELPNAVVLYSSMVAASQVVGPTLAGLLVATLGYGGAFAVDAGSYVFVLVALALIRDRELRRKPPAPREKGAVRAGIAYLARHRELRIMFIAAALVGVFAARWEVSLPLFAKRIFDVSDATFTLYYAMFSLGALVASLLIARWGAPTVIRVSLIAFALGVSTALLALIPSLAWSFALVFVVGGLWVVLVVNITTAVQMLGDEAFHGRLLALQSILLMGTAPVGGLLLGWLADVAGARVPLIVGAVAALAAGTIGVAMIRRDRFPRTVRTERPLDP